MAQVDEDGRLIATNALFRGLLGLDEELILESKDRDGAAGVKELIVEACERPGESLARVLPWDGRRLELSARCARDDDAVFGCVVVATDVTARYLAEEALRESEARYRLLFDNADALISIYDGEGRCLAMNRKVAENFGGLPEDFQGKTFGELHPDAAERYTTRIRDVIASAETCDYEDVVAFPEGDRWLLSTVHPVFDSNEVPFAALILSQDVTARRAAEGRQRALEEEVEHKRRLEAIGRLAGGVAHDFNNLLMVINNQARELAEDLADAAPDVLEGVALIIDAGKQAAELTSSLLAFGRRRVLEPELLTLDGFLEGLLPMLRKLLGEDIDVSLHGGCAGLQVSADRTELGQVLLNLAVNARDAMPSGGPLAICSETVELDEAYCREHPDAKVGAFAMISVADGGLGMDGETLRHAFEPFYTKKGQGRGTGLGLSQVHGIIEQAGGFVRLASMPAQGTTVRVYLPLS